MNSFGVRESDAAAFCISGGPLWQSGKDIFLTMKILHTSDWHLGRMIYGKSLLDDQRYFIEQFFYPLLDREQPDAVILAGDIFDRQIAPVEALRLFDGFVSELCGHRGIPLVAVSGNHDGADRLGLGRELLGRGGFHIASRLDAQSEPFVLPGAPGQRDVHIYALPYFDPAMARDYLQNEEIKGFTQSYAALLSLIRERMDASAFNLLIAHCFVTGAQQSDSESPLFIGGSGEVETAVFDGFDYVALGHLHRAQNINGHIRYAGSPLKYSFDEQLHKKSVTMLEIAEDISAREVPVIPMRDMRVLTGTLPEIGAQAETDTGREDYIFAQISGAPVYEPMHAVRKYYPNALGVKNGSDFGTLPAGDAGRSELKSSTPGHIFNEFIRQMCGGEASDDDRRIFERAYNRVTGRER